MINQTASENSKWRGRFFRYAPLVLWIGLIFYFSSMQGAMTSTSRFIRPLLVFLFPQAPEETLILYHVYIRKFAHFAVYAVLAFWSVRALQPLKNYRYLFAFTLVLFVASADEFNQSFNPARTGSVYDILLDCSGGLTMIVLLYFTKLFSEKAP